MADSQDHHMADGPDNEARLPLSEDEQKILALYDKLQEVRLEIAIINAQHSQQPEAQADATEEQTQKAQDDLLEAQAKYKLRNEVVEAVIRANPVLRAVHNGINASPVERDLLPYVERRDDLSKSMAKQASDIGELRHQMTEVQSQTLHVTRKNVQLAAELFDLAEQVERKKTGQWEGAGMQPELAQAEDEVKSSKRRWRIMKGVASGMVAGSGVNWAADESLCEIVLDPEDEDE